MATVNSIGADKPIEVSRGGTGAVTMGDGLVVLGSGSGALTGLDVTAQGSLLIGDDTTDPQALALGTDDYVLTADSTESLGVKWAASAGGGGSAGWTLITTVTMDGSGNYYITSGLGTTYDNYMFISSGYGYTTTYYPSVDAGSSYTSISFKGVKTVTGNTVEQYNSTSMLIYPHNKSAVDGVFKFSLNKKSEYKPCTCISAEDGGGSDAAGFHGLIETTSDIDAVRIATSASTGDIKVYGR